MKIPSNDRRRRIWMKTFCFSRILYISLHCFDAFPPNEGHPNDSGKDRGLGFNVNLGLVGFCKSQLRVDCRHTMFLPGSARGRRRLHQCFSSCDFTVGLRGTTEARGDTEKRPSISILVQSWIRLSLRGLWCRWGRSNRQYFHDDPLHTSVRLSMSLCLGMGQTFRLCLFANDSHALIVGERPCLRSSRSKSNERHFVSFRNKLDRLRVVTVCINWTSAVRPAFPLCWATLLFVAQLTQRNIRKTTFPFGRFEWLKKFIDLFGRRCSTFLKKVKRLCMIEKAKLWISAFRNERNWRADEKFGQNDNQSGINCFSLLDRNDTEIGRPVSLCLSW